MIKTADLFKLSLKADKTYWFPMRYNKICKFLTHTKL